MDAPESRLLRYARKNPGADFIVAFLVTLLIAALVYSFDRDIAGELVNFAFFSLVAGVVLQAFALWRVKEDPS